jgi:DNA polymerase elongation subunit (family B)
MKRADALGIGAAMRRLGRMRDELSSLSMSTFSSKAFGTRTDLRMRCSGRIPWDVMRILRREVKSRSYSLNAQALEWTGKKKHELSHDQIGPSWIGPRATPITRRRVLDYNENDARLSYEINAKKLFIWLYQELARATGVSLETILNRGQGIKTLSQVLREAHANQFLVRTFRDYKQKCMLTGFPEKLQQQQQQQQGGGDKKTKSAKKKTNADDEELLLFGDDGEAQDAAAAYQGATVIDPILGYYQVPITTLDFSSLYPSIDIAWNLCWTTYTTAPECAQKGWKERPKDAATGRYIAVTVDGKYRPEIDGDYIVTPVGHYFVTKRVREGILPRILVGLLKRRSEAKVVLGAVKNAKKQLFVLREKLATATTTMPDAIEALRKEVVTAIDKLDGVVKKIEPTALPMFDPLRTAFNALVPPLSATSIAVLNTLCDQYESLELTYDARQNALKICANSGYGFTGAHVGPQPLKAIAASITAFGRVAIETKRTAIEREFPMDDTVTQNGRMRPIVIGKSSYFFLLLLLLLSSDTLADFCRFFNIWKAAIPTRSLLYSQIATRLPKLSSGESAQQTGSTTSFSKNQWL